MTDDMSSEESGDRLISCLGSDSMLNGCQDARTAFSSLLQKASSFKRRRQGDTLLSPVITHSAGNDDESLQTRLLQLPGEVLELILSFLDSATLAQVARSSKVFRSKDKTTYLTLADKVAKDQLLKGYGILNLAARWRNCSWLERLNIEETVTLFDKKRCEKQGFMFTTADDANTVTGVKLEGIGPKLLLSDVTTADVPLLRWRLELKGNNAVEFGTVPVTLQDQPKALHKCYNDVGARPSGFCSAITVGSMLPVKLPLMRGSIVEILARKDRLQYIVTNPPNGMEMTWHNTITVPKPYKGPLEFRFEQDLQPNQPVKLAVTCWARAAFEVLHTQPNHRQQSQTENLGEAAAVAVAAAATGQEAQ